MNEAALVAEINAWRAPAQMPIIPKELWAETAERLIRETLVKASGKPHWYVLRKLLQCCPFTVDQTEFKTIWYREQRRQLNEPEPIAESDSEFLAEENDPLNAEAASIVSPTSPAETHSGLSPKTKPVVLPADYQATAERILTEVLAEHRTWRNYGNNQITALFTELARRLPFSFEPEERPEYQTEAEQLEFMRIWYAECKVQFGFADVTSYVPTIEISMPAKPQKAKQLTLF